MFTVSNKQVFDFQTCHCPAHGIQRDLSEELNVCDDIWYMFEEGTKGSMHWNVVLKRLNMQLLGWMIFAFPEKGQSSKQFQLKAVRISMSCSLFQDSLMRLFISVHHFRWISDPYSHPQRRWALVGTSIDWADANYEQTQSQSSWPTKKWPVATLEYRKIRGSSLARTSSK